MKIERVSSDKFRVRISRDELREMNVNPEMFISDSNALNDLIMRILREIHEKTDFKPFMGSMTMEASADSDGMSIVLSRRPGVTEPGGENELRNIARMLKKLGSGISSEEHSGMKGINSGRLKETGICMENRKIRSVKAVKSKSKEPPQTFVFGSFDDMCHALCRLSTKAAETSELCRLDDKYMMISHITTSVLDDLAMLMEFASEIKRGMAHEYVREHGECIAEGKTLSEMCGKITELV